MNSRRSRCTGCRVTIRKTFFRKTADSIERRIEKAVQMMKEIDRIMALPDPKERERALMPDLKGSSALHRYSMSTVCEKRELEWPTRFYRMNFLKILKTLLMRRKPNVFVPPPRGTPPRGTP